MSDVTRERSVWIELLRRVCVQHDIYTPSFPLPEMSLDELEHAATACRRFSSRLRKDFLHHQIVWPHSIRSLEPPQKGEEFENLCFLPGGRFLVTSHRTTIKLWDLGNHATSPIKDPIASVEIGGATAIKSLRTRKSISSFDALIVVSAECDK
jgi:WD40 repeat protein